MSTPLTVTEVIAKLKRLPKNAPVYHQDTVHPDDPAVPLMQVAMIKDDEQDWILLM